MARVAKGSYIPDNLIISTIYPIMTSDIVVAQNQTLVRGEVFELNAEGNAVKPITTIDPTKVYGIMAESVETTTSTKVTTAYLTGEFNKDLVVFPAGETYTDYKAPLRKIGIFLK